MWTAIKSTVSDPGFPREGAEEPSPRSTQTFYYYLTVSFKGISPIKFVSNQ